MTVISKGGDGKSTTAGAYADALARRALRTLVVDTDHQGTLTRWLLPRTATVAASLGLAPVLAGRVSLTAATVPAWSGEWAGGPDVLPATRELTAHESGDQSGPMARVHGAARRAGYDVVVLDTSASRLGGAAAGLQVAALTVADVAVVVARPTPASVWNIGELVDRCEAIGELRGRDLPVAIQPTHGKATTSGRALVDVLGTMGVLLETVMDTTNVPDAQVGHRSLTAQAQAVARVRKDGRQDPADRLVQAYTTSVDQLLTMTTGENR